jgi:hypothetical protein
MIQIIGFLICACLAVKLLEMVANPAYRLESGTLKDSAMLAQALGWASVVGFTFWLVAQGGAFPDAPQALPESDPLTQEQVDCITNAKDGDAVLACAP